MSDVRRRLIGALIFGVLYSSMVVFITHHARSTYAATLAGEVRPPANALSIEWEKVLLSAGLGWVFSGAGSLAVWLLFRSVGHRILLVEWLVFSISMAISRFEIAVNLYLHGVNYAVGWQRIAALSGVIWIVHVWQQRGNLFQTLSTSEEQDKERAVFEQDAVDNETMAHDFHMEALNRLTEGAERRGVEILQRG